jgi:hypothetical protein
MFWKDLLQSFGVAKFEKLFAGAFGLTITLTQIHSIIGIILLTAGGVVSIYYAIKKHRVHLATEKSKLIISVIRDLTVSGDIKSTDTLKDKEHIAEEFIKNIINNK